MLNHWIIVYKWQDLHFSFCNAVFLYSRCCLNLIFLSLSKYTFSYNTTLFSELSIICVSVLYVYIYFDLVAGMGIENLALTNFQLLTFRFFAHISLEYLFTFWTCYMLYKEYERVAAMRLKFLASQQRRAEQFTVSPLSILIALHKILRVIIPVWQTEYFFAF